MSDPKLPPTFRAFIQRFPQIETVHAQMARAVESAGLLDRKTIELVKIGISSSSMLESALRSHVRRAHEAGARRDEIEQAVLLSLTTVGFPRTVAAWQWATQELDKAMCPPVTG